MRWLIAVSMLAGTTWNFDADDLDKPPSGFEFATTAKAPAGKWIVKKDGDATVLAQIDQDKTDGRYAMAVVKDGSFKDVRLSVRGKPVSGEVDQSVGLVWRYKDSENYYVARSNVIEKNVRLYRVVDGKRIKFASKDEVEIKHGAWQTLKVEHVGKSIRVFLDDKKMIEAEDEAFKDAGRVGLWIKADAVTYFDDLTAEETK
jgi:3-keto-disaccharide hydrolase